MHIYMPPKQEELCRVVGQKVIVRWTLNKPEMPNSLEIGFFVFGAILILVAFFGGNFKLFGAEFASTISNTYIRLLSFALGCLFIWFVLPDKVSKSTKNPETGTVIQPPVQDINEHKVPVDSIVNLRPDKRTSVSSSATVIIPNDSVITLTPIEADTYTADKITLELNRATQLVTLNFRLKNTQQSQYNYTLFTQESSITDDNGNSYNANLAKFGSNSIDIPGSWVSGVDVISKALVRCQLKFPVDPAPKKISSINVKINGKIQSFGRDISTSW